MTENKYKLYMHENKINQKKYIGITCRKDPKNRWGCNGSKYRTSPYFYNAIKKYGWDNFSHIILLSNLTEEDAKKKEKEYIKIYNSNNRSFGYNCTDGGDGAGGRKLTDYQKNKIRMSLQGRKETEEHKNKIRIALIGRKMSNEWKQKIRVSHIGELNPSAKKIVHINKDFSLNKEYLCMKYAADELNLHISHIQDVCEGRYTNTGGYIFMYSSVYFDNVNKLLNREPIEFKPYKMAVNQLDLDGNFIENFNSIKEASVKIGINKSSISRVCKNKQLTCGGYKWEYAS